MEKRKEYMYELMSKDELIKELKKRDAHISYFEKELDILHSEAYELMASKDVVINSSDITSPKCLPGKLLSNEDIKRYSRQLILPELGPVGQKNLLNTSVLIVGCGGLGCPAAIYLAAAGVGRLGLCDSDEIEISNLHRQVLHQEKDVGKSKALSVAGSVKALNSSISVIPHILSLDPNNAIQIVSLYDIVLDCTDNVPTRYLINDVCVMLNKPLVSGSALRFEGHVALFNYKEGPCYRCLFPTPPPPSMVTNCSDGGVLGVVPGVIGCLQALQTIKIVTNIGDDNQVKMTVFDGKTGAFRTIRLRSRQTTCKACGIDANPQLQLEDYQSFCGFRPDDKSPSIDILNPSERISVWKYHMLKKDGTDHLLVDVRARVEYSICTLQPSLNIPYEDMRNDPESTLSKIDGSLKIVCICRQGNDSQMAVKLLKSRFPPTLQIVDVIGGLNKWSEKIDNTFPSY